MKTRIFTLIAIALMLTLTSCYKDPQTVTNEGNGFQVEYLFTKDSIKFIVSAMADMYITSHQKEKL